MKEDFNLLEEIIDKEITAYSQLHELCIIKQETLVKNKAKELIEIDSKIINKIQTIKPLVQERNKLSKKISNEELNLSQIIEKTAKINPDLSKKFATKKEKINELLKEIKRTESINSNLIKHGIKLVEKTAQIIFSSIIPNSDKYNNQGKLDNPLQIPLSSVNEEI